MTLHVPDCRCHPVHGNADTDGIDARCQQLRDAMPECVICGEPGTAEANDYNGEIGPVLCPRCTPEEPGDNFYEGRG
jgi:hypothetical protein